MLFSEVPEDLPTPHYGLFDEILPKSSKVFFFFVITSRFNFISYLIFTREPLGQSRNLPDLSDGVMTFHLPIRTEESTGA